jgi:hypothetical protein
MPSATRNSKHFFSSKKMSDKESNKGTDGTSMITGGCVATSQKFNQFDKHLLKNNFLSAF